MIKKIDKNQDRLRRHLRVRKKISGTAARPRLCIYRSLNHVYLQLIDDVAGNTLCSASSLDKALAATLKGKNKVQTSFIVAGELAKKAQGLGITEAVFDRGGYIYTGRVKSAAEGARDAGLKL